MKVFYTSPYRGFAVTCGTCDKEIDERDGLLHCPIDEEDYHPGCVPKYELIANEPEEIKEEKPHHPMPLILK
jgi:hypothetical protein